MPSKKSPILRFLGILLASLLALHFHARQASAIAKKTEISVQNITESIPGVNVPSLNITASDPNSIYDGSSISNLTPPNGDEIPGIAEPVEKQDVSPEPVNDLVSLEDGGFRNKPELRERFVELQQYYKGATNERPEVGAGAIDEPTLTDAGRILYNIQHQLTQMSAVLGRKDLFKTVHAMSYGLLDRIDRKIKAGLIDPTVRIRTSENDPIYPVVNRTLNVGGYPVSFDPPHWGHLTLPFIVMKKFNVDKMIFLPQGNDPIRKPNLSFADIRHEVAIDILAKFFPFYGYSDIAKNNDNPGELNIFRLFTLNPKQPMHVFYLVGDDHYKLFNSKGEPDTIPKIENYLSGLIHAPELQGFNPAIHKITIVFIQREKRVLEKIPSIVPVHILPPLPFKASSSDFRDEKKYELTPFDAYQWAKKHGLYGLTPDSP